MDKPQTHSTLQVKPDLSPITSTATLETLLTWCSATAALNSTLEKLNDDLGPVYVKLGDPR